MRAVIRRVRRAQVSVDPEMVAKIQNGLLVFLGVGKSDTQADADYLSRKLARLCILEDVERKMNLAVTEVNGQLLVVSQFRLYGNIRQGTRPSLDEAAPGGPGRELYEYFYLVLKRVLLQKLAKSGRTLF